MDNYKGKRKIVSVFIECPLSDRYERLNKRYAKQFDTFKEANQKTLERIVHDACEFNLAKASCDYVIDNHTGNFANAMMKIINICMENGIIQVRSLIMPYVYENHLNGGFYTSDEELSVEELYCEQCEDHDLPIGYFDNAEDLRKELKEFSVGYEESFIDEFVSSIEF